MSARLFLGQAKDVEQVRSEAFAAGTKAIEADPLNGNAFCIRGMYQCNERKFVAGLRDLRRAHALNPNDAIAPFRLGYAEAMNGDASRGVELIRQAMRLSPKDF